MTIRVLTVDDSRTIRDMLKVVLVEAGMQVTQAEDGVSGLEALGEAHPDVIITDVNMPRMDGLRFISEVRKKPEYGLTPILVLTTEFDPEKKAIAKSAGATGWIVKPFHPDKLVASIHRVVV